MNAYEFIFSNRPGYRISRHMVFWICCWIFYLCTYFIPVICFPGWKIQGPHLQVVEQLGSFGYCLFNMVFSSRFMAFQLLFTYFLIYFLLPRFLVKEKYISFTAGTVLLLIITAIINYYVNYKTQASLFMLFDLTPPPYSSNTSLLRSFDTVFFNLPAISGIAIAIKLLKHWFLKKKESQHLITSKANAELQLLKAQVHPHFLFNTLNNIYSFILTASPKAPEMIKKLSGLLHYIIYECKQSSVPLEKEIKMIKDYISLETIRYGDQLEVTVDIRGDYSYKNIAPLLLIPFVENSFKHGTSKMLSKPWVNLNIIFEDSKMYFMLNNSRPEEYIYSNCNRGIGLVNVQKRLQLLYPGNHEVNMTSEAGHFTVLLEIDLHPLNEKPVSKKENLQYEMA